MAKCLHISSYGLEKDYNDILQDLTGDEIDEMIREADLDGDGKVKHLVKSFKTKKFSFGFLKKAHLFCCYFCTFTFMKDVLDSTKAK